MGVFHFKQFDVDDRGCGMKICSDSVLLAGWFLRRHAGARRVLDVGSGSGILSLAAAQFCPEAEITGIEIDLTAAETSAYNFGASLWAERLDVFGGNFQDYHDSEADLIICNPPYFTNGEKARCDRRAAARHQSELTYSTLMNFAGRSLVPQGHVGLVAPAEAEEEIIYAATLTGLSVDRLCRVHTSPQKAATRILVDVSRETTRCEIEELSLHTEAYRALVGDLYMKI